jgi:endonuclease YncB( thermonuclease family)
MSNVKIKWNPKGFELDSLGQKKITRITDGDTPFIEMSIRMLSIDTPELHYPGMTSPDKFDAKFKKLADWIGQGSAPLSPGLGDYLKKKLGTGKAGRLHKEQGEKAREQFQKLLDTKLKAKNGKKKPVFLRAADEHFDQYGRLLAYLSPHYTREQLAAMTLKERATFNLLMVESGWAASFPIYPSLPKIDDFALLQEAGQGAFEKPKGVWKNPLSLTGYEYRMCVRLFEITEMLVSGGTVSEKVKSSWIERYCVDITTAQLFNPEDYYKVLPYNRLFLWPKDVAEAKAKLNLV